MKLDCVLIGHNETDYDAYANAVKPMQRHSAAYTDAKTNSILLDGKRLNFMEVFNLGIERGTGEQTKYSSFNFPSQAVSYLTSFLRRRGFSAMPIFCFRNEQEALASLLAHRPHAVAITTTFYVSPAPIREVIEFIRARSPETTIIVGGPYVFKAQQTMDPDSLKLQLESLGADVCIIESQGEKTLAEVVKALRDRVSLGEISNLMYWDAKRQGASTTRTPENNDLDAETIDWRSLRDGIDNYVLVRTARSCAFKCSFCAYPQLGGSLVTASVDTVERELIQLRELGVRYVHFVDDTFNIPKARFKELCRMMIRNNLGIRWSSFFRCGNADDEQFELAAQSGCFGVELGIESADDRVLKNMNKAAKRQDYLNGIKKLHAAGILTYAMFFVGFPGETAETVQNTMDFICQTEPTFYIAGIYYHDVSTPIHGRAAEFGIKGAGYSWRHNTMTWNEAADWVCRMYRDLNSSIVMPLQGFSFESIGYLLGKGFSVDTLKSFCRVAQSMVVDGLDDNPVSTMRNLASIENTFRQRPISSLN